MLPLLLPLVTTLAPQLIDWLFGSKASKVAGQVVQVVQTLTGADPSTAEGAAAAQAACHADPALAVQLQTQLATIAAQAKAEADREADAQRQADLDQLKAALADTASARAQTVDLDKAGSDIAWSAPIMSVVILLAFAACVAIVLTRAVPPGGETLANVLLGTLAAMASQVANYWLGSSNGSASKNVLLARKTP